MLAKPKEYIGKITTSKIPYYDNKSDEMKMKSRPVLIIGVERDTFPCDFNVLPVSTISIKKHINPTFDFEILEKECHKMNLNKSPSYVRVHKQSTCHSTHVNRNYICDLLYDHNDIYVEIIELHSKFNESLF